MGIEVFAPQDLDYLLALTMNGVFEPVIPSVAWTAVCLAIEHPELPAVDVLDRAVRAHPNDDLAFQFDAEEELSPPHPFAELLRRAFAPHLHPLVLHASLFDLENHDDAVRLHRARIRRRWNRVICCFADRYGIWEPE